MDDTRAAMAADAANGVRDTPPGFDGMVRKAFDDQKSLLGRAEHCSLDPDRLHEIGRVPGQSDPRRPPVAAGRHLHRLRNTAGVDGHHHTDGPGRAWSDSTSMVRQTPSTCTSKCECRISETATQRREGVRNSSSASTTTACQNRLVVLAPHGGSIESRTDQQAERALCGAGNGQRQRLAVQRFRAGGRLQALSHHVIRSARVQFPAPGRRSRRATSFTPLPSTVSRPRVCSSVAVRRPPSRRSSRRLSKTCSRGRYRCVSRMTQMPSTATTRATSSIGSPPAERVACKLSSHAARATSSGRRLRTPSPVSIAGSVRLRP